MSERNDDFVPIGPKALAALEAARKAGVDVTIPISIAARIVTRQSDTLVVIDALLTLRKDDISYILDEVRQKGGQLFLKVRTPTGPVIVTAVTDALQEERK